MFGRKTPPADPMQTIPYDELVAQRQKIDAEMARRGDGELESLKQKLLTIAKLQGLSIKEMFAPPIRRKSRVEAAKVRYRNPDNPEETWSGRGKPKKWLQEKLDQGRTIDEFSV